MSQQPDSSRPPFRLQGKYFFLTYARCDEPGDDLLLHLLELSPGRPNFIRVAVESHEDGTPHLHAGIRYADRIDIRSELHFDYRGFHPNIQKCSSWGAVLNYLAKDGCYFDFCDEEYDATQDGNPSGSVPIDYADRVQDFASYSEWLNFALASSLPFGYAHAFWAEAQRDAAATILAPEDPTEYWKHVGRELRDYTWEPEERSYVLSGPSGIGKTSWCKHFAPKPSLFVGHLDALRQFRARYHRSIIFDDVSFAHLPTQSQIHICDFYDTRQIHMRHRVQQIPAGIYKFFTINPPYKVFIDFEPIKRRCIFIDIG